mmetsp:Transcript_48610/g.128560  ORF Transcript_48610/g.128560 Transcript_48610/m.128560 type:complete len:287 (+) Transcript_48610:140-1000(+)
MQQHGLAGFSCVRSGAWSSSWSLLPRAEIDREAILEGNGGPQLVLRRRARGQLHVEALHQECSLDLHREQRHVHPQADAGPRLEHREIEVGGGLEGDPSGGLELRGVREEVRVSPHGVGKEGDLRPLRHERPIRQHIILRRALHISRHRREQPQSLPDHRVQQRHVLIRDIIQGGRLPPELLVHLRLQVALDLGVLAEEEEEEGEGGGGGVAAGDEEGHDDVAEEVVVEGALLSTHEQTQEISLREHDLAVRARLGLLAALLDDLQGELVQDCDVAVDFTFSGQHG